MSLIIRRLVDTLYPRSKNGLKIPFLGLDASGKTTLLYRWKLGEVVVTIPTIGFNYETIQVHAHGPGKSKRLVNVLAWDVGGCGRLAPSLMLHYTTDSDALIWLVDACDRERIPESVDELTQTVRTLLSDASNAGRTSLPVLIIVTKRDLPNPMSIDEIRTKFARATSGSPFFVVGTTLTQSLTEGTFPEAFGWLIAAIDDSRVRKPLPTPPVAVTNQRSAAALLLESKLAAWLERAERDASPDVFLRQFETLALPAWDHYTHIRIAYLLLTVHGRQKGKDLIFDGIERYIAKSEQTRGRTFHVTMTYFWIQIVHFGMRGMPPASPVDAESISETSSTGTLVDDKSADDFARFLLINPFVADGNLWAEYYSKEVMMSPGAKAGMVLPDKKPLPNLVSREAVSSSGKGAK
ncbi:ADP-ribosylation factor [Mycena vulgaris]|nr:ADP-ribosylation factor [Mycena vulgaris]